VENQGFQAKGESVATPEAMAERVFADACRAFNGDPAELEPIVRTAVDELWSGDIKVKTFVPVLALRRVRDELDTRAGRRAPEAAAASA